MRQLLRRRRPELEPDRPRARSARCCAASGRCSAATGRWSATTSTSRTRCGAYLPWPRRLAAGPTFAGRGVQLRHRATASPSLRARRRDPPASADARTWSPTSGTRRRNEIRASTSTATKARGRAGLVSAVRASARAWAGRSTGTADSSVGRARERPRLTLPEPAATAGPGRSSSPWADARWPTRSATAGAARPSPSRRYPLELGPLPGAARSSRSPRRCRPEVLFRRLPLLLVVLRHDAAPRPGPGERLIAAARGLGRDSLVVEVGEQRRLPAAALRPPGVPGAGHRARAERRARRRSTRGIPTVGEFFGPRAWPASCAARAGGPTCSSPTTSWPTSPTSTASSRGIARSC